MACLLTGGFKGALLGHTRKHGLGCALLQPQRGLCLPRHALTGASSGPSPNGRRDHATEQRSQTVSAGPSKRLRLASLLLLLPAVLGLVRLACGLVDGLQDGSVWGVKALARLIADSNGGGGGGATPPPSRAPGVDLPSDVVASAGSGTGSGSELSEILSEGLEGPDALGGLVGGLGVPNSLDPDTVLNAILDGTGRGPPVDPGVAAALADIYVRYLSAWLASHVGSACLTACLALMPLQQSLVGLDTGLHYGPLGLAVRAVVLLLPALVLLLRLPWLRSLAHTWRLRAARELRRWWDKGRRRGVEAQAAATNRSAAAAGSSPSAAAAAAAVGATAAGAAAAATGQTASPVAGPSAAATQAAPGAGPGAAAAAAALTEAVAAGAASLGPRLQLSASQISQLLLRQLAQAQGQAQRMHSEQALRHPHLYPYPHLSLDPLPDQRLERGAVFRWRLANERPDSRSIAAVTAASMMQSRSSKHHGAGEGHHTAASEVAMFGRTARAKANAKKAAKAARSAKTVAPTCIVAPSSPSRAAAGVLVAAATAAHIDAVASAAAAKAAVREAVAEAEAGAAEAGAGAGAEGRGLGAEAGGGTDAVTSAAAGAGAGAAGAGGSFNVATSSAAAAPDAGWGVGLAAVSASLQSLAGPDIPTPSAPPPFGPGPQSDPDGSVPTADRIAAKIAAADVAATVAVDANIVSALAMETEATRGSVTAVETAETLSADAIPASGLSDSEVAAVRRPTTGSETGADGPTGPESSAGGSSTWATVTTETLVEAPTAESVNASVYAAAIPAAGGPGGPSPSPPAGAGPASASSPSSAPSPAAPPGGAGVDTGAGAGAGSGVGAGAAAAGRPWWGSSRLVLVLRLAAVVGVSLVAVESPGVPTSPGLLWAADMAVTAAGVAMALVCWWEVWRTGGRRLFPDGDPHSRGTLRLAGLLLGARVAVEVAHGVAAGDWSRALFAITAGTATFQSCLALVPSAQLVYAHMAQVLTAPLLVWVLCQGAGWGAARA
ncbi:hypothetical protein HYH03_015940 [Edaphochlamys debaryana]|uniref:Uncharacterized protein n=1 Tax=Edaphochlamys debaryana TaxID=47281 RepID=A0A836BQQ0_9CHLO|nr:hypothetical protein HYH03_015940 [Edaphochlamys debaryana]|eukprot:KAG2485262.1 hypothetical protein HYH03_015940 [Edaphochlamys debaryana]